MHLDRLHQIHARHLQALRRSPATIEFYRQGVLPLTRFMEARGLEPVTEAVDRALLIEFQLHLREGMGLKPGGEHGVLRALRATFRWALDEELVEKDPTVKLRLPTLPQERPPAVQPEQVEQCLKVAATTQRPLRDKALLLTMYDTGMRLGEIIQLRTSDVDLVNGLIKVRSETAKRQKARPVPLGIKAAKALTQYERRERDPALPHLDTLFLTRGGEPMTRWTVTHLLLHICAETGYTRDQIAPHAWRRGFAVQFLRNGGGVFTLQQILGHSTLAMTRRYVQYLPDDLQRDHLRASPADRL